VVILSLITRGKCDVLKSVIDFDRIMVMENGNKRKKRPNTKSWFLTDHDGLLVFYKHVAELASPAELIANPASRLNDMLDALPEATAVELRAKAKAAARIMGDR